MKDKLNKEIANYNSTVRKDYGIYLTSEQKDVIIEFIEKQLRIGGVSQQRELLNAFAFYMVKNSNPNDGMTYKDYVEQWLSI